MLGSTILDVAIGIVFIFLLTSLIASAVREGLEAWLKTRASHLEAGLREILKDPDGTGLVHHFYNHPLIYSLFSGDYKPTKKLKVGGMMLTSGRNLPSYIPSRNFALALMDMAARGPEIDATPSTTGPITLDAIRTNVGTIENLAVQRALLIALDRADGDLATAQASLEAWYNSSMDRVSGWYKRSSQAILLVIGLVMAIALNVNTLRIAGTLYHDKTARDLVVASAENMIQKQNAAPKQELLPNKDGSPAPMGAPLDYQQASGYFGDLSLLVGWPHDSWPQTLGEATTRIERNGLPDIAGWLITAFAVSIGAPFWFDLLNRLIVIRSTVKPHQKSPEEPSTDNGADAAASPASAPAVAQAGASGPLPLAGLAMVSPVSDSDGDGCEVDKTANITTDEMLPAATGGVR